MISSNSPHVIVNKFLSKSIIHSAFSTCPGDSGGPLFDLVNLNSTSRRYIQYGVIHGSIVRCSWTRFPGIFVRVTEPLVWKFIMTLGKINGVSKYNATKKGINNNKDRKIEMISFGRTQTTLTF